MSDEWMVHQLKTTSNFATNSKLMTWYASGWNFQIERHLLPALGDLHRPSISRIMKKCTQDFNVPYNESKTFFKAISSNFKLLKTLGRAS